MPARPLFHQMIEVIDLTTSDDEQEKAPAVSSTTTVSALPLRLKPANVLLQRKLPHNKQLRKRPYEDTPHPQSSIRARKRLRQLPTFRKLYCTGVSKLITDGTTQGGQTISLLAVLEPRLLDEAVLCLFECNAQWILQDLGLDSVKTTLVCSEQRGGGLDGHAYPNLTVLFLPKPRDYSAFYQRLMLLFHTDGFLRVVIPTANLQGRKWSAPWDKQSAGLDNAVFVLDLPRLGAEDDASKQWQSAFRASLLEYLDCLGLDVQLRARIYQYNFDQARNCSYLY